MGSSAPAPLVADLQSWTIENGPELSPGYDLSRALVYMIKR
jgi:hypothetical protein